MKSLAAVIVLVLIWGVGLLSFAARIDRLEAPISPPTADGVVAFTGSSTERIEAAMSLVERGKGRRLLVSGVNRQASRDDIRAVAEGDERVYACCVDLGFQAETTVGNAEETAAWARRYDFERLIVVTADYHMPRSLMELRAVMPEAELIPYPVVTRSLAADTWWRTSGGIRRMVLEYSKYLAVLFREGFLSLGPDETPQPAQKAATA